MFYLLEAYPIAWLTALMGTLCAVLFFVTSSDSASLVADIVASGGNQSPPKSTRLFWGILEGVLAAILLLAGGLQALRAASVAIGLPFCILLVLVALGLIKDLMKEPHKPESCFGTTNVSGRPASTSGILAGFSSIPTSLHRTVPSLSE
jgi:choline/glycine/proline betaine transport protein